MEYSEPENFIGSPIGRVDEYVWSYIHKADSKSEAEQSKIRNIMDQMLEKATATLIKPAQHAKYELEKSISQTGFSYEPQDGYAGKDAFSYLVKYGPYTVKVNSYVHSGVDPWSDDYPDTTRQNVEKICGKRGTVWRVVSLDTDNAGLVATGDYSQTSSNFSSYAYLLPQVTFRDLTGAAVGETVGEGSAATITLDTDAAGHGWYEGGMVNFGGLSLDANFNSALTLPLSQGAREFNDMINWLPTGNPNEWAAKAGTAAEGKMDMLSVLLHEYGHALGIEHSADSHDYMGTTLTPGMRRLPSADEMQLMAQLAGEARDAILAGQGYTLTVANSNTDSPTPAPSLPINMGFGISFLGLLRRNNSASSIFANAATAPAQYDIAANATLTNGNFAGNNTNAWETTGKVNATNGAAVLSEVSTSQTRLNQVFVVGAQDRYLSFTLGNIGLEDANTGPDDAFEVALLNANTGASLKGNIGLSRTDALLNLQANGNELKATGVTSVTNADGSRTYVVDLAGIAVGTAVNLSFDLIGFGTDATNTNSHVTVRDVRLVGEVVIPQTNNDIATGLEDTVMHIIALANDVNANLAGYAPVVVAAPAHGAVVVNADGSFSYTPVTNYFGADSFTYQLSDGVHQSNVATVNLTVTAVNDAPTLGNVSATTAEDTAVTLNLLANAADVDSTVLSVVVVTQPAHGTLAQNADGTVTYTPNANFNGVDSFTYKVNDGTLDSAMATVSLVVTAVNDAPVLVPRNLSLNEDAELNVDLLVGATDVDGDALTATIVAAPQHGSLVKNADGTYTYKPAANYFGSDSFSYQVNDGSADSNVVLVSFNVTAVNDAPVATDTAITLTEDNTQLIDLLALVSDVDSTVLTPIIVTPPAHGTLVKLANGSFSYTPNAHYFGADSFSYRVSDGQSSVNGLESNLATVNLTVTAVNDAPTAGNLSLTGNEDHAITINLLANATDIESSQLSVFIVAAPQHGQLSVNADGSFTYTPAINYHGADSFTYKVNDGVLDSAVATVNLTVTAVNDAPEVAPRTITLDEDVITTLDLLASATDVDGDTLTATVVTQPEHGSLVKNADGTYTYTPAANFNGADSFSYQVNDGSADSNVVIITLNIAAVNDAPIATDASITLAEDTTQRIDLRTFASDVDNTVLTPVIVTAPTHGTLNLNADGTYTYTPAVNYFGSDRFTYQVTDGNLSSNLATISLVVTAVNDAPVVNALVASLQEDGSLVLNLSGLSSDVDGDVLTLSTTNPQHGSLVKQANGSYTYTPTANYNGADSFTVTASDGSLSASNDVQLTITAVNDIAVAVNDTAVTNQGTAVNIAVLTNDTDADNADGGNAGLVARVITSPLHGTVAVNANGSLTYTPDADFYGVDSFTYVANDGMADSNLASVTITVNASNRPPVANNDTATVNEDGSIVLGVLTNDSDADGDALTIMIETQPAHGQLVLGANNTITYTPTANYFGADSFTYRLSDGKATSGIATVNFTVNAVNDAPVTTVASVTGVEDTAYVFNWADFNASDMDSAVLSIVVKTLPVEGRLEINNGTAWVALALNQAITQAEIAAGRTTLCAKFECFWCGCLCHSRSRQLEATLCAV